MDARIGCPPWTSPSQQCPGRVGKMEAASSFAMFPGAHQLDLKCSMPESVGIAAQAAWNLSRSQQQGFSRQRRACYLQTELDLSFQHYITFCFHSVSPLSTASAQKYWRPANGSICSGLVLRMEADLLLSCSKKAHLLNLSFAHSIYIYYIYIYRTSLYIE